MRILIPCRSGSRRIPNKNFLLFNGRPMLLNAVSAMQSVNPDVKFLIFVDDADAERLVKSWGLNVVKRKRFLNEHSETLREFAIANSEYLNEYNFLMLPTSIFVNKPIVKMALAARHQKKSFYVASRHNSGLVDAGQLYGFPGEGLKKRLSLVNLDFCSTAVVKKDSVVDINVPEYLESAKAVDPGWLF